MLSTLITSKVRVALITLFAMHPDERYYQSQIIRELGLSSSLVQAELKKLERIGFVRSSRESNTRYFVVNREFPLYSELKSIIYKTVGLADALREGLASISGVEVALVFGSVASDLEDLRSDVDLLLVGDVDLGAVHDAVDHIEADVRREINPIVFSRDEWADRVTNHHSLAIDILSKPVIILWGDERVLREPTA